MSAILWEGPEFNIKGVNVRHDEKGGRKWMRMGKRVMSVILRAREKSLVRMKKGKWELYLMSLSFHSTNE